MASKYQDEESTLDESTILLQINRLTSYVQKFVENFGNKLCEFQIEEKPRGKSKSGKTLKTFASPIGKIAGAGVGIATLLNTGCNVTKATVKVGDECSKFIAGKISNHRNRAKRVFNMFRESDNIKLRTILVLAAGDLYYSFQNQFILVTDSDGSFLRAIDKLAIDAVDRTINYIDNYGQENNNNNNMTVQSDSDWLRTIITKGTIFGDSKTTSVVNRLKKGCTVMKGMEKWKTEDLYKSFGIIFLNTKKKYIKNGHENDVKKFGYRIAFEWEDENNLIDYAPDYTNINFNYNLTDVKIKELLKTILNDINNDDPIFLTMNTNEKVAELQNQLKAFNVSVEQNMNNNTNIILEQIKQNMQSNKIPPKKSICFDIKMHSETFIGREFELNKIHTAFESKKKFIVLTQTQDFIKLGGLGKSELARKYCNGYCDEHDGNILWINAETKESLISSFQRLATCLDKIIEQKPQTSEKTYKKNTVNDIKLIVKYVYEYFENVKSLFVFDNSKTFNDIREFLPMNYEEENFQILITSENCNEWTIYNQIKRFDVEHIILNVFTSVESMLFIKRCLQIDADDISKDSFINNLCNLLQNFPLALQLIVNYINMKNELLLTDNDRIEIFEINDYINLYNTIEDQIELSDNYSNIMYKICELTLREIQLNNISLEIIQNIVYLSPNHLNLKYLIGNDEIKLNAIQSLHKYSLINVENEIVNIHRLIQEVIRLKFKKENNEETILRRIFNRMSPIICEITWRSTESENHILIWKYASEYSQLVNDFYLNETYYDPIRLLADSGHINAVNNIIKYKL